jgi:hypothetical protein
MRALLVSLVLGLCAAPGMARADLTLRCGTLDGAAPAQRAAAGLEVPALAIDADLGALLAMRADEGGGARGGAEAGTTRALALVLGIFPGFGLGHLVASSPRWTFWLVVDVALLFASVLVWVYGPDPLGILAWVATFVERVVEGVDAFHAAGGRFAGLPPGEGAPAWAFARPVRDPSAGGFPVARF